MRKKHIIIAGLGILIIVLALLFAYFSKNKMISINGHKFKTQVVSSQQDLQKGLGGRNDLCQDCAMLFVFSKAGEYNFWMKDMQFPLDVLWINQGKIVHMEKNVAPTFGGILKPETEADQVFEINAGLSDQYGFEVGDPVEVK